MILTEGSVVRAKAGRDKDKFFVVVKLDKGYAYICDGKRRRLENPKKKNVIHLHATNTVADSMDTNRKIKKFLSDYTSENTLEVI
ncbi:MAG: KOW domain-containing RNA-binding protein [Eubacteriales bacterium]|nr:KOW domain-containing RNA-binding protein [Eubacteriales bacterium]